MTRIRLESPISDAQSPDFSTCEHCGVPVSWDEVCYTHDTTGFAECSVRISGGTEVGGALIDPVIEGGDGPVAEPVEWYADA